MTNDVQTGTPTRSGGASKLAMLISFIAGAFAAWIVITVNTEYQQAQDEADATPPPTAVVQRPTAPHKPATPHSTAPKAGAPKPGT